MTTAKKIEQIVSEIPADFVFTYRDLGLTAEDSANVIKKLNRLAESGVISKLSKGRYFKPKKSIFGALNPSVEEVVKDLLERNGNIIGYLTNYSVYSQLGLTSQIPNIIVIGSNTKRSKTRRGNTEIRFVLQRNEITKANIYLLQLLDVTKSIKSIPDSSIDKSCARLLVLLTELSERQTTTLIRLALLYPRLALLYPPRVIALLGAMLQQIGCKSDLNVLRNRLNPISSYNYGISQTVLSFSQQWKIK